MSRSNCIALGWAAALVLTAALTCGGQSQPMRTATPHTSTTVSPPKTTAVNGLAPEASPTEPPFGFTPMPMSQNEALWDWIAANSLECEPILRPTYLPSGLSRVSLGYVDQQRGCVLFGVDYWDSAGQARLFIDAGPWPNPPLPAQDTVGEDVEVRGNLAGYELYHAAEPLGLAFLTWHEPGRWGRPGDDWHRDYVEYLISAEGFSKEELLRVANSLRPMTQ